MPKLDIIGPSYKDESLPLDAQETINMFLVGDPSGRNTKALKSNSGLTEMIDTSGNEVRALQEHNGKLYAVVDNTLYELDVNSDAKTATKTSIGTLQTSAGFITGAQSNVEVIFVDGNNGYVYNTSSSTFTTINDVDFLGADTVVYIDGYFLYNVPDTQKIYQTASLDGTSVGALNFSSAESGPDNVVALAANKNELWALGERTTEVYYNAGNTSGLAFTRRPDVYIDIGLAAKGAVANIENGLIWLTDDRRIVFAGGYEPQVVSTDPIHEEIASYNTVSDCIAYSYTERGHTFAVFTFPTAGTTWCYDVTTNSWHRRQSTISDGNYGRHLANCHSLHKGLNIVGDHTSGKVFYYDKTSFKEDTRSMRRVRTTRHYNNDNKEVFVSSLSVYPETGVGLSTGQGSDPQVMMQYSIDGGRTFSNELWRSLGAKGEYYKEVRWTNLGRSKEFTVKFIVTDPVDFNLIDASVEVDSGGI